jgi:hypothetical protein
MKDNDREYCISVGKLKNFKETLLDLGFDSNEAGQYLTNLDKLIREEIEGLNSEQGTSKMSNTGSIATKSSVLNLSTLPKNLYINTINPSLGNLDKFTESYLHDKPTDCPF